MSKPLKLNENIVLTGFMGTGKTSSGIIIAGKTGRFFVDTDDLIEQAAGLTINEIFESKGEKYFRKLEKKIIAGLSGNKGLVISTGGGVVTSKANMSNLRKHGKVFALVSDEKTIFKRVSEAGLTRPLVKAATKKTAFNKIKILLNKRMSLYMNYADFVIDTSRLSPEATAEKVLCRLKAVKAK